MSQAGATGEAGEEIRETSLGGSVPRPRQSAWRRFFLLEEALAQAEARRFRPEVPGYADFARAREAEEAVRALMAPREPLRYSDGTRAASMLSQKAALFAMRAHLSRADRHEASTTPLELWEAFSTLPLASKIEAGLGRDGVSKAHSLIVEKPWEHSSSPFATADQANLALLRDLVSRLLAPLEEATRTSDLIRIRRALRIGAALVLTSVLAIASTIGVGLFLRGPNLALNRPTSASSAYGNQKTTSGVVDGIKKVHGFHTDEEQNPWLQIDLGANTKIGSIVVYNRTDCCEDRAAPLVIETSVDGNQWAEVAKRNKKFSKWKATFPQTEARFVRLTVRKKTWFHLSEVEVYKR